MTKPSGYMQSKRLHAGQRFGRLIAIVGTESTRNRNSPKWKCICDCGNTATVLSSALRLGRTTSCGCFRNEMAKNRRTSHDMSTTSEYKIWAAMKARCLHRKAQGFKHYGGRGIKMCVKWQHSFEAFILDMGLRPSASHSIERRNVDGNYTPKNCFWLERKFQARNTRNTVRIKYQGKKMALADVCDMVHSIVPYSVFKARVCKGWSIDIAATTPLISRADRNRRSKFDERHRNHEHAVQ